MAVPHDAGAAYAVGRMARRRAEYSRAETWFRRAIALARQSGDWQSYALAFSGLGNLYMQRGNFPAARRFHVRALRAARRHSLRQIQGAALHDLFVLAAGSNHKDEAERYARGAFEAYGLENPRLSILAHDLAYFWMERGHFAPALTVFEALIPHMTRHEDRLVGLANIVRAAAGAGQRRLFEHTWDEVWDGLTRNEGAENSAQVLLELAHGAAQLGEHERSERAAERAVRTARERGESKIAAHRRVGAGKRAPRAGRALPPRRAARAPARAGGRGRAFAADLVRSLNSNAGDRAVIRRRGARPETRRGPRRVRVLSWTVSSGGTGALGERYRKTHPRHLPDNRSPIHPADDTMKIGARPLLVLHGNEQFRERVRKVAGKEYTFQAVPDWPSLEESVRDSPPSALVVVNPYEDTNGRAGPSPALRSLLVEFPSTAVFAALEVKPERVDDLRTLGKWGVVQVISIAHDDTPQALVQRFRHSQGRPLKALLENRCSRPTPRGARAPSWTPPPRWWRWAGTGATWPSRSSSRGARCCAGASAPSCRLRASCWRGCASCSPASCWTTRAARCCRWRTPAATRRTAGCGASRRSSWAPAPPSCAAAAPSPARPRCSWRCCTSTAAVPPSEALAFRSMKRRTALRVGRRPSFGLMIPRTNRGSHAEQQRSRELRLFSAALRVPFFCRFVRGRRFG
jgi:tetratricopeptide (TPR) repeat protein